MKYLISYLLLINAAGFLIMLNDKRRAIKKSRRIPERTLLTLSLIGGSIGVYLAMVFYRHKTKHPRFSVGIPLILTAQALIGIFYWILT